MRYSVAMNTARNITSLAILLKLGACGDPCLPTISADTLIKPAAEECFENGSSSAAETTGDPVTCEPAEDFAGFVCVATPQPGEAWGPCLDDNTCTDGFCRSTGIGDICLSACTDCGCDNFKCTGGTCEANGACVPSCDSETACLNGTVCDVAEGLCVYPDVKPPACQPPTGSAWAPCDNGTCDAGLFCIQGETASMCAPDFNSVGGQCPLDLCMATMPQLVTIDAATLICGHPCNVAADCHSGQICSKSKTAQICMWPTE